jgi:chromosome segregation ATPase
LLHAQEAERRSDVVILPQELNDQFQSLKNYLSGSDGQVRKLQETREEIKKRYPDTRDAQDLDVMLKGLDQQEQSLEAQRKDWKEKMAVVEAKIKDVILSAHGQIVEWRTYNPNPVDKLGTVITTTYTLKGDHVVTSDAYDQLPYKVQR